MRRILAVVVAIALIGGAYVYRTRDGGSSDGGGRSSDGPLTLVCTTELAEICQAVEDANSRVRTRVEPAWNTFDAQADATDIDFDVWLAAGPWPQMLDGRLARTQKEPIFDEAVALASAPLVVVIYRDDLQRLPCAASLTWDCLGDSAASGALRLGAPDPGSNAAGTAVIAAATGGDVGDPEYARNDLQSEHEARVTDLGRRLSANAGTSVETMLATPALLDARADVSPAIAPVVAEAASRDRVQVVPPSPLATLVVTAGVVEGSRGEDLLEVLRSPRVTDALRDTGWEIGAAPSEDEDGLPSPGVLEALRELLA